MWQPDGWSFRARLGLLVPHAAIGAESELQAMAASAGGVSIHATRVPLGVMRAGGLMDPKIALEPVRAFADPPLVDDAAALLAAAPLHAIGFGFTSSSYVRGAADDENLRQRLEARTRGIPVAITSVSAVLALRALEAQRIALVDPPWFSPELTALGVGYFRGQGFAIVHAAPAGLPSEQLAINPGQLFAWARDHVPSNADAVYIGGNGLRAVGVIQALEEDLQIPVLTANQVLFWHLLGLARARGAINGYGRIFDQALPPLGKLGPIAGNPLPPVARALP
ncbi:MAG: maleate cis-trans isomerase [Chloroflexota bacterium]|nr:maleate cis-trans isomerase [Chloroflexota bacterium]